MKMKLFCVLFLFLGCNINVQPGIMKDCPSINLETSGCDYPSLQNNINVKDTNTSAFIKNHLNPEIEHISRTIGNNNRYVLYFESGPEEYIVIDPIELDDKVYIINGKKVDSLGYTIEWGCHDINSSELSRIKQRLTDKFIDCPY